MPELRECPFCGMAGENMAWRNNRGELTLIEHPNTDCPLADMKLYDADLWNHRPTEDRLREENKSLLTERTEVMEILAEAMGHESVGDHAPLTMADAVAKALVSLRRQVGEVLELLQAVAKSEQSRICCGHGDYRHYLTVGWELEGKIKQFLDSLTTPAEEGSGE